MTEPLCGPWEGSWLQRHLPGQAVFKGACAVHDDDYTTPAGMSRKEADDRMLGAMLEVARCPFLRGVAYSYYGLTRVGGWAFYDRRWERLKEWVGLT